MFGEVVNDVVTDADALLILTRWELFNDLPDMIAALDKQPLVIDARRMLNRGATERYDGIGYAN